MPDGTNPPGILYCYHNATLPLALPVNAPSSKALRYCFFVMTLNRKEFTTNNFLTFKNVNRYAKIPLMAEENYFCLFLKLFPETGE